MRGYRMSKSWEQIHLQRAWGKYLKGIEKYSLTYENQQKAIIHWIIEARRI